MVGFIGRVPILVTNKCRVYCRNLQLRSGIRWTPRPLHIPVHHSRTRWSCHFKHITHVWIHQRNMIKRIESQIKGGYLPWSELGKKKRAEERWMKFSPREIGDVEVNIADAAAMATAAAASFFLSPSILIFSNWATPSPLCGILFCFCFLKDLLTPRTFPPPLPLHPVLPLWFRSSWAILISHIILKKHTELRSNQDPDSRLRFLGISSAAGSLYKGTGCWWCLRKQRRSEIFLDGQKDLTLREDRRIWGLYDQNLEKWGRPRFALNHIICKARESKELTLLPEYEWIWEQNQSSAEQETDAGGIGRGSERGMAIKYEEDSNFPRT